MKQCSWICKHCCKNKKGPEQFICSGPFVLCYVGKDVISSDPKKEECQNAKKERVVFCAGIIDFICIYKHGERHEQNMSGMEMLEGGNSSKLQIANTMVKTENRTFKIRMESPF